MDDILDVLGLGRLKEIFRENAVSIKMAKVRAYYINQSNIILNILFQDSYIQIKNEEQYFFIEP
jgi:hypothetical protein